jgi:hypothetical protein
LAEALRCAGVRLRCAVERLRDAAVERVPVEAERLRVVLLRRVVLVLPVLFWVAMFRRSLLCLVLLS